MPDGYADEIPTKKEITRFPIDWYRNFGLSEQTSAMRLFRDKDGMLLAIPVTPFMSNASTGLVTNVMPSGIVDSQPGSDGTNSFARCLGTPGSGGVTDATVGLVVNDRQMGRDPVSGGWVSLQTGYRSRNVSGVHAAQAILVQCLTSNTVIGGWKHLEIHMTCSAGTATLVIEATVDGTNWLTIDSIAAAATTIKHYDWTTVGGTVAISPIGANTIRVTAGDAGVGNTTTVTMYGG